MMPDDDNESIIEDGKADPSNKLNGDGEHSAIDSEDKASGSLFRPEDVGSNVDEDKVPGTPGQTQLRMPSLCDPNGSPVFWHQHHQHHQQHLLDEHLQDAKLPLQAL
jgi:hypothetical protein